MRSLPEQRLAVLKEIEKSGSKGSTMDQIQAALPTRLRANIVKTVSNMKHQGLLNSDRKHGERPIYTLTDKARERLNSVDSESRPKRKYTRRKPPASPPPPPEPAPAVNISTTANALADNITALISENAAYRELMISVYDMIAKRLDLRTSKDQDNGE